MFEIGKEYKRKTDIHGVYGGQAQGGISTPKNHPFIFIFTSQAGEKYGYRDEYRDDGVFWYTGERQIGDMKMISGNKAIQEHEKNNKTIYLFEYTKKAHVRYVGTAEYLDHHEEIRPDRNEEDRTVFVFHLDINSIDNNESISEPAIEYGSRNIKDLKNKGIKALREAALRVSSKNIPVKEKRRIAYYRSEAIKSYAVARSKGKCEGCKCDAPFNTKSGPFLECHHLYRLADGGPDHPKNVVALCPNCHRRAHYAIDAECFNDQLKIAAVKAEESLLL